MIEECSKSVIKIYMMTQNSWMSWLTKWQ